MAIEKKLICCKEQANFDKLLEAGDILDYSIVFIKDTQRIWTHGTYFSSLAELMEDISSKQDKLTPGANVEITEDNIISVNLDDYVTNSSLSNTLENYVTTSTFIGTLGDYITSESLTSTLENYATVSALDSKQDALTAGDGISISTVNGEGIIASTQYSQVNTNTNDIASLRNEKQDALQYYYESADSVGIKWDDSRCITFSDDGFCDLAGGNGVDVRSNTYFKYNNTNVLTMNNILVGSKDIAEIGFDNSNLIDSTFGNWNDTGCVMSGTTVQGAACYQATLSSSSNSLSTSVSLSSLDPSITSSWFTFSFYTRVTSTNTLYIEISPLDTSVSCLIDGEERTASDVISLVLSPTPSSSTNIKFHTVSFKIDASQMINPSLTLTLTTSATSGASVTVGAPKLEIGKFATITPEVTTESEKVLDEIRSLWPSSAILNRLGYWFDSDSYISSAQIMDYDSVTQSVRIRFYLHPNGNVTAYWVLSMEGNTAQVISNCGTPNFYGVFDLVVPYSDGSFLTLTHQYSLIAHTS